MTKFVVLYISNQGGGAPKSLINMIHSLKDCVHPIVLFENDWEDYQKFKSEGIECIIVPFRMNLVLNEPGYKTLKWRIHRWIDERLKNRKAAHRVAKVLRGRQIDVVHCNTGAITIGTEVAKALNAKFVWHLREFQDIDFGGYPYNGWNDFYQRLDSADAVIGITKAIGNHFHFETLHNAHVIWNAVCSKKESTYSAVKDNYILYCSASIVKEKGLHELLEAYGQSALPAKGIILKVLGKMDSLYKPLVDQKIEQYNIKNFVKFEGSQTEVKTYFEHAKAFILPSFNEGLGRVVIESMFYGCPVIARKAGGPVEYIQNGKNGYLFSSIDAMTDLLNSVCEEVPFRLIENAQHFAAENFSEEMYGEKVLCIYNEVLNG